MIKLGVESLAVCPNVVHSSILVIAVTFFNNEDFDVGVLSQSACNCESAKHVSLLEKLGGLKELHTQSIRLPGSRDLWLAMFRVGVDCINAIARTCSCRTSDVYLNEDLRKRYNQRHDQQLSQSSSFPL